MGAEGMAALTPVLPLLHNLLSLDLGHQFMNSEGAQHLALVSLARPPALFSRSLSLTLSIYPSIYLSIYLSISS